MAQELHIVGSKILIKNETNSEEYTGKCKEGRSEHGASVRYSTASMQQKIVNRCHRNREVHTSTSRSKPKTTCKMSREQSDRGRCCRCLVLL